jgi:hypothetical protein
LFCEKLFRILCTFSWIVVSVDAHANALRKMSEKGMLAAADVVVVGRVIGTGFQHDTLNSDTIDEFASVLVETVQKGVPARPLKVFLYPGIAEMRPDCCVNGIRYKMYLQQLRNGMYESVDGRYGIISLDGSR